jgi:hypothetical protein
MRLPVLRCVAGLFIALVRLDAQADVPRSGAEVLQRMHDAYQGKWYRTLTFRQTTTLRRADGTDTVQTWYETLRHTSDRGTWLRIDIGNPALGNGVLFSADSTFRMTGGKLATSRAGGNEFLPLIEGVYLQPVDETVRELAPTGVDMSRVTSGTWRARRVWIVGAATAADTSSPQIWIDAERNVVVRMILQPAPTTPPMDVHLDGYVAVGQGWLATQIEMFVAGARRQAEQYADWKVEVALDSALFSPATWTTARHWARPDP